VPQPLVDGSPRTAIFADLSPGPHVFQRAMVSVVNTLHEETVKALLVPRTRARL
jgi:hypothetical protein